MRPSSPVPQRDDPPIPPAIRAWIEDRLAARAAGASHSREPRQGAGLLPLLGGAGARRYWRVQPAPRAAQPCAVLMHARPEDASILPPALRVATAELPFLRVGALLARHGLRVPEIYAVHPGGEWVLLEDLGDLRLVDLGEAERPRWRRVAIECLAKVHAIPPEPELPFERRFDREWVRFELDLFLTGLPEQLRNALDAPFSCIAEAIEGLPRVLCLRDFQSQNLMIDPRDELRLIDYQDALLAPPELDLAAFLHDSYAPPPAAERAALLDQYRRASGRSVASDALALLTLQRKCKDLSRFRLLARRGELRFAPYVDHAARAIREALPGAARMLGSVGDALRATLPSALEELVT